MRNHEENNNRPGRPNLSKVENSLCFRRYQHGRCCQKASRGLSFEGREEITAESGTEVSARIPRFLTLHSPVEERMAKRKLSHSQDNVIPFPRRIPATFCQASPNHEHCFHSRPQDPVIKRCCHCGLWLFPKDHALADEIRQQPNFVGDYPEYPE